MLCEEGILSVGAKSREPYEAGNGRVYDPIIGLFLSLDPVIQAPDFTQNYNSYSYCFNNPLKYSDPTGLSSYYDPWTNQDGKYHSVEEQMAERFGDQWGDIQNSQHQSANQGGGFVRVFYNGRTYLVPPEIANDPAALVDYFSNNPKVLDSSGKLVDSPLYNSTDSNNSETVTSDENEDIIWGFSFDGIVAVDALGWTAEAGILFDNNQQFVSNGYAVGLEASVAANVLILIPFSNFKRDDVLGSSASAAFNIPGTPLSISVSTATKPTNGENSTFKSYAVVKVGFGVGAGGRILQIQKLTNLIGFQI